MVQSAQNELFEEMKNKWVILSESIDFNAYKNQKNNRLIRVISQKTNLRLTLIQPDGKVLDDSYFENDEVINIKNHLFRSEIQDALHSGDAYANRLSQTTQQEMIYYAKILPHGTILRLAYPATYINALRKEYTRQSFSIFIFLFILITLITIYLARRIALPIQKLDYIAEKIEKGDSHIHFPQFHDSAMLKIGNLIHRIYKAMLAEKEILIQQQEKQDYIFGILEEGIILLDEHNNILYCNKKAETYLNTHLVAGKNIFSEIDEYEVLNFFNDILTRDQSSFWEEKEFRKKLFEVNLKVTSTGAQWEHFKKISVHKDRLLKGISQSPVLWSAQKEKLIVFSDMTEKVKYQKFKSKLVCNISHELKTPLAMIMGYAETILDDPRMPQATATRFLKKIYKNSERINKIINNVLGLHKLESSAEGSIIVNTPSSVSELIEELKSGYEERSDIHLEFLSDATHVNILYDHLYSILSNLVSNAVKYSKGDIVFIHLQKKDQEITLSVEDQGPAIAPEEKDRIFERFYTVSNSRNREHSGTGLGLPIVKHIAQQYSGHVQLTQGKHRGNVFIVTLQQAALQK